MASTEEIRADLAEIVNEVAGIPADDVQLDKSFVDDLDVDSLSMVEVVVAAEEKFGVKHPRRRGQEPQDRRRRRRLHRERPGLTLSPRHGWPASSPGPRDPGTSSERERNHIRCPRPASSSPDSAPPPPSAATSPRPGRPCWPAGPASRRLTDELGRAAAGPDRGRGRGRAVRGPRPGQGPPARPLRQFALIAAREAWADAGLEDAGLDPERLGVAIASGIGGVTTLLDNYDTLLEKGAAPGLAAGDPDADAQRPGGQRRPRARRQARRPHARLGLRVRQRGDRHGVDMIRLGRADVVVAGGTEAAIHPLPMAAFAKMMALSKTGNDERDPTTASRPWDKGRDGFVLGEGAAVAGPRVRGARRAPAAPRSTPRSRRRHHRRRPRHRPARPRGSRRHPRDARWRCARRDLDPADVVHINAHATSTPQGDIAEGLMLHAALGDARRPLRGHQHQVDDRPPARCAPARWRRRHRPRAPPPRRPADDQPRRPRPRGRPRHRRRRSATCPTATSPRSTTPSASAATTSPSPSAASEQPRPEDSRMTTTATKPAKLPREQDPRNPVHRLAALFDEGTLELITPDDDSGMLAAIGRVDGTRRRSPSAPTPPSWAARWATRAARSSSTPTTGRSTDGVPIVGLWHSGGARLAEGVLSLHAVGRIFQAMTQASGKIPQISVVLGPAAGGAAYGPGAHRRRHPRPRGPHLRHRPRRRPLGHRRGRRHAAARRPRAARPPLRRRARPHRVRARGARPGPHGRLPARRPGQPRRRRGRGPRPRGDAARVQEARLRRAPARRAPARRGHHARAARPVGAQHRHRPRPASAAARSASIANNPLRLGGCLDSPRRRRPRGSCGCATRSACRWSSSSTCPATCPASARSGTASYAAGPSCCTPSARRRAAGDAGDPQGLRRRLHRDELPLARRHPGLRLAGRRGRRDGCGRRRPHPAPPQARRGRRPRSARRSRRSWPPSTSGSPAASTRPSRSASSTRSSSRRRTRTAIAAAFRRRRSTPQASHRGHHGNIPRL